MSIGANVLVKRREIIKGPVTEEWALDMTVKGRVAEISIRGRFSMCDCSHNEICGDCGSRETVRLFLVGTFNPGLKRESFTFWGMIPVGLMERKFDEWLARGRDVDYEEQVAIYPEKTIQLVYGRYTPWATVGGRGWITPLDGIHNLNELFRLFSNTDSIRRTFEVREDRLDRERKVCNGEFIRLPADRLWGLFKRGGKFELQLRQVETQREGKGTFAVVGISSLPSSHIRFQLIFTFVSDGAEVTYHDAWVEVTDEGRWDYIWAMDKKRQLSWVQSQLQ
jgi:hypothetical protein